MMERSIISRKDKAPEFFRGFLKDMCRGVSTTKGQIHLQLSPSIPPRSLPLSVEKLEKAQEARTLLSEVPAHIVPFGEVAKPVSAIVSRLRAEIEPGKPLVDLSVKDRAAAAKTLPRVPGLEGVAFESSFLLSRGSTPLSASECDLINGYLLYLSDVTFGARRLVGEEDDNTGFSFSICTFIFF